MDAWLIGIIGGAIGTVLAAALTLAGRFIRARSEVITHDRAVSEHDQDLASWVSDRHLLLRRDIAVTTEEMNQPDRNLFYSGAHANALALLKEQALHQYRDELRRVQRSVAALREREGQMHERWRRWDTRSFPTLDTPAKAQPILDTWRSSITRHGSDQIEVHDPTRRDLDDVLARLSADGARDYV